MNEDRYSGLKFQAQPSNSSFDLDQTEGGQKVSKELADLLDSHDVSDEGTLQILWDLDIWSVADLRNATSEQLTQAGMKKFKVTKLKGIVDGKLSNHSFARGSTNPADRMGRGSFSFNVPQYNNSNNNPNSGNSNGAMPPKVGRPATQTEKLSRGSFSFPVPDDDRSRNSIENEDTPRQFGGARRSQQQQSFSRSSRDSRNFAPGPPPNGGSFNSYQPPPPNDRRFSYQSSFSQQGGGPPMQQRSSSNSFSYGPTPPPGPPSQRGSYLGAGLSGGSMNGDMMPDMMAPPPVIYEDKAPTTNKGSDATGALDSLNNMWTVLETPDDGEKKPVFKAEPGEETTKLSTPSANGNGGGSGLNVKMVDHRPPPAREVIDQLEEALDGDDSEDQGVEPEDLMRLAHRLIALKQYDAALPYTMRAAKRYERRRGLHDMQTMLAVMLAAKLLRRLSHFEKAIEYFALLLDIQEKLLGTDHADTANTASALGQLYAASGSPGCDLDRAATCFQQVLHIREKLVEVETDNNGGYLDNANPTVQIHLAGCAMALHHLGVVHSDLFKYEEALGYFMRALKIRRSLGDSAEKDTASTLNNMAAVLHQLDRNEQCLAVYARSLEIKKKLLPPTHPSIADTLYNMGALNLEIDRPYEASEFFLEALTISTTKLGMHHSLTIDLQKQILTCDQLMAQQNRLDVNLSRDGENGFNNMNNAFVMNNYGDGGDRLGSFANETGSISRGSFSQGAPYTNVGTTGSFSNPGPSFHSQPSFSNQGGSFNYGGSGNNGSFYNGGSEYGGSFSRGQARQSQGGGSSNGGSFAQQPRQSQGDMSQHLRFDRQSSVDSARLSAAGPTKTSSSGTATSVLDPPRSPSDNTPTDPDPQRKRTGSSDNDSVASHRSLGGGGVVVEDIPMQSLTVNN